MARLFVCHGRMTGDAKLLLVNLFRDGQFKGIPLLIALLLVGRNRIMNLRLYTMV